MKVQLLVMIKDGEEFIKRVIEACPCDRIMIFDTGSTDNTISIIKDMQKNNKNILLKHITFTDFANTRNKCFELSKNTKYQWTIFLDDSYIIEDYNVLYERLKVLLANNIDIVEVDIKANILEEINTSKSLRIFKTSNDFKYIGTIHEYIDTNNKNYKIAKLENTFINDLKSDNQFTRTLNRVYYDIKQLEGLEDPRSLYYLACSYYKLFIMQKCDLDSFKIWCIKRIKYNDNDNEEKFTCAFILAMAYSYINNLNDAVYYFILSSILYKERSGEVYYYLYQLTKKDIWKKKALENKYLGKYRLCAPESLYGDNGLISKLD